MAEYHFILHHKAGTANKKADLFSQQADHEQGKDNNNEIIVLKPKHFQAMIMPMIKEAQEQIKSAIQDDHLWGQNVTRSVNHDQGMRLKEGLIYYDERI